MRLIAFFSTDPSRILAPPFQYGLIDTSTSLNCTTTFNETNRISITWTREGEDVSHQLDRVRLDNEGLYKCSVFLGNFNLRAERMINFSVIGKPVSTHHITAQFSLKHGICIPCTYTYSVLVKYCFEGVWYLEVQRHCCSMPSKARVLLLPEGF